MSLWSGFKNLFKPTTQRGQVSGYNDHTLGTGHLPQKKDKFAGNLSHTYTLDPVKTNKTTVKRSSSDDGRYGITGEYGGNKTPQKANQPQPSRGGASGGYTYSGGGGGGGGGGYATSAPAPATPAPPPVQLEVWKPNMDNISVYNPDFAAYQKAQDDILASFGKQRDVFNQRAATQKQDLEQRFNQIMEEQARAKQDSQRNFAVTRRGIQDSVFDAQRADQAAASSRGLGESGAAQLGEIQRRMAEGDALSGMAQDYYDAEGNIIRAQKAAKENQDIARQEVENSLAEAMSGILGMETQQKSQYTSQMDNLKRQVREDTNSLEKLKNQYGREHVVDKNQKQTIEAQFAQQAAEFEFRKQQAAAQAAQAAAAQRQSAAQFDRQMALKEAQYNQSLQGAGAMAEDNRLNDYEVYKHAMDNNLNPNQFQTFVNAYGNPETQSYDLAQQFAGLGAKNDKKKGGVLPSIPNFLGINSFSPF